ncbi:hypothetical protein [Cupriavidus necator]|uniref:hypothetical protein n=1 Tax=Cupriavidus necator TaxID=106590 RepID=UPI0012D30CD6|nr:hypothetical protein [Cupriavidus necator]
MIYGPDGHPFCSPLPEVEKGILYADLDPTKIVLSKNAADPVGHYSRPDTVRLVVDKTRRTVMSVVTTAPQTTGAMHPQTDQSAR